MTVTDIYWLCDQTEPTPIELRKRPTHIDASGITLTELGRRCGWAVPHQTVYKFAAGIRDGSRYPTINRAQDMANATGQPFTTMVQGRAFTVQPE